MPVIILVADGARPDALGSAMDRGELPALARLRAEGASLEVATCWPSVTGVAYTPFLMGRFPGPVGLPGLRWFDRTRETGGLVGHARSYVGADMLRVDRDLAGDAPTLYELTTRRLGALSVIQRGLPHPDRVGSGVRFALRTALTHLRGDVAGWLEIDRNMGRELVNRIARDRPQFVFAAFTGIDKSSHACGHTAPLVRAAMEVVDGTVAAIRDQAERAGTWDDTHLWIVSDHGHSRVSHHDDLVAVFEESGVRTLSHPWTVGAGHDMAVMVSGNAMAHLYVDLSQRVRPYWPAVRDRWGERVRALEARSSVDLVVLPISPGVTEVRGSGRGHALIRHEAQRYSYHPESGDPLGIGAIAPTSSQGALDATWASDYPDAIVQIASLASAPRCGDIVLSAARDWDFRARYEPIPHLSSHGALHREHMLVPLITNRPVARHPRRTVDVMPSALRALGLPVPPGLDGESFL